uniref:Rps14 n=1 Tax=Laurentiella strenua TaxID=114681 RepID=A0A2I4PES2_9SPIT|nr:rps14 [Laurentiella strenua]
MIREEQWKLMDNLKRKLFLKNEIKKILLKSLIKNKKLPLGHRYLALWHKSKLSRYSSFTQQQNRCVQTGRIWYVLRTTQYSRFFFRTESYKGHLPGFQRASW